MSKGSPPAAPDPTATIAAQDASNSKSALQTAELNRINQNTPYGSLSYQINGYNADGTPQYTQNQTLSPSQQNLFDMTQQGAQSLGQSALGLLGQVQNSTAPLNYAGAPGIASHVQQGTTDYGPAMQQAENAAYLGQTQYLNPQFSQKHEALDNNLINQGITQGSAAANTAQQNLGLQENQAYGNADLQAVQAGQNEQNTLFGQQNTIFNQGLSNANLQNSANAQYLQQLYTQQAQPLNEYNALASGSQVQQPNFSNFAQSPVATTNSGQLINQGYQNQLGAYQASQQGINNLFSLGGSLGAAAILA